MIKETAYVAGPTRLLGRSTEYVLVRLYIDCVGEAANCDRARRRRRRRTAARPNAAPRRRHRPTKGQLARKLFASQNPQCRLPFYNATHITKMYIISRYTILNLFPVIA